MFKFRTRKNYADGEYLGPRLGEKVFLSFLIMTLYWGIGDDHSDANVVNVSSALFMWTTVGLFVYLFILPFEGNAFFTGDSSDVVFCLTATRVWSRRVRPADRHGTPAVHARTRGRSVPPDGVPRV